jgi:type VI secretion system secreted protein Hcp
MTDIEYFLTVPGVAGSSTDKAHPGAIPATEFSWGMSTTSHVGGGPGAARPKPEPLVVTAPSSIASPELFIRSARGNHLAEVTFIARKGGEQPLDFLTLTLKEVIIASYHQEGHDSGQPSDSVELAFRSMTQTYVGVNPDGSAAAPVTETFDYGMAR